MFREKLPIVVRNHIAEMTFTTDTYKAILTKADQVFNSNQSAEPVTNSHQVAAVAASTPASSQAGGQEVAAEQKIVEIKVKIVIGIVVRIMVKIKVKVVKTTVKMLRVRVVKKRRK